jgi:vancomycin resistance protein VanJ
MSCVKKCRASAGRTIVGNGFQGCEFGGHGRLDRRELDRRELGRREVDYRTLVTVLSGGYLVALIGMWGVFRWVGEYHWATALLLYVPRVVWGLPLLGMLWLTVLRRDVRLAAATAVGAWVWFFPLMGFRWRMNGETQAAVTSRTTAPGGMSRVLSLYVQNVHDFPDVAALITRMKEREPDLIVLQEAGSYGVVWWKEQLPDHEWHRQGEHLLGSKLDVSHVKGEWARGYVRYDLEMGARTVTLLSIHPPSPQFAVKRVLKGQRPEHPGEWSTLTAIDVLRRDVDQRRFVLTAIAEDAASLSHPVIIAGDSNTPDGGRLLREHFAQWTDAFSAAGEGFGYTFPAWAPWLRLDRAWVTSDFVVLSVRRDNAVGSDHWALDVELRPAWEW